MTPDLTFRPRDFDGPTAHGEDAARRTLAAELGCDPTDIVSWRHPDRDTLCLSLPDADGVGPWMESVE